jgi:copper homeostasis protein (lipoprotein)
MRAGSQTPERAVAQDRLMLRHLTVMLALAAVSAGGCSGGSNGETERRTPMPATLAGVYSGMLPCSNCAAIEATLWLRTDGAFVLRQRLLDDPSAPRGDPAGPSTTFGLGRWSWDEVSAEAVLRGRGPERRLVVRKDGDLQLRVASPIEHLLARDATAPPFTDRLVLEGESAVSETGATFKECATGVTFAVADAGVYRELRRQHRRMNARGKVALTTVEGHLAGEEGANERLVVDEFVAIKPGTGC